MLVVSTPPTIVRRSVNITSPRKPKQLVAPAAKKSKTKSVIFWKREKCDLNASTVSEYFNDDIHLEPYEDTLINRKATAVAAALMDPKLRKQRFLQTIRSPIKPYSSSKVHTNNNCVDKVPEKTFRSVSLTPKQNCSLANSKTSALTVSLCTLADAECERRPRHRFSVFSRKWKRRVAKKRGSSKRCAKDDQNNSKQNNKNMKLMMDTTLQIVLRHSEYSERFRLFLKGEYSEENFDFWTTVEYYRLNCTLELQNHIYDNFIKNESPQEVNLSCQTKVWTTTQIMELNPNCFDSAQSDIYQLMEKDTFPRFILSVAC